MQCPVKTPGPQLCPGFWNSQVKYFVALASLVYFFFLFLSGLFSAEGSLVKPIPAGLLYFLFSLLMPMERQELPTLKHLCCVGLAVIQVCERNYFCRKNLVLRFFRKIGDKKEKLFSKTAFLILHAGVFCWIL